ncbi:ATP-dependent helicase [Corynebacterium sanguinis]|uniref:ATP-dependent helicase n=1 Tax=Corynebacterium sanguinis TaxID=2594913 RepID=UPI0015EE8477|nr:ATP-dependent helicase [Corynebacterium sanguinis]
MPSKLSKGIAELDSHQQEALITEGNLVIVAGPGSGKTRTVVARAGYLLSTRISPLRGLATITYTNQAATELKEGLAHFGVVEPERLFAGTLHSFCLTHILPYARLVGIELPRVEALMDGKDELALLKECADDEKADYWGLREVFTVLRRRLAVGEDVTEYREDYIRAVRRYEAKCEQDRVWDFEGVVLKAVRLLQAHPEIAAVVKARFPMIMVDEYQDLGLGLHCLIETLLEVGVEVTAVGDADQSIYGWAGGDPKYLNTLCARSDFSVRRLITNYRCGSSVVAAAELVLAEERGWRADPNRKDPGTVEFQVVDGNSQEQAQQAAQAVLKFLKAGVPPHEIAVLLRFRSPLGPLVRQRLADHGVAVRFEGEATAPTTGLGRWIETAALYAICMTTPGKSDPPPLGANSLLDRLDALHSSAGYPRRFDSRLARTTSLHRTLVGNGTSQTSTIQEWARRVADQLDLEGLAAKIGDSRAIKELRALTSESEGAFLSELASDTTGTGKVVLSTYHGAKGRTFTSVILPGLAEGVVPPWGGPPWNPKPLRGDKLEEERRNFYVSLTRSRGCVLLQLSPTGQNTKGETIRRGYSTFATALAESLGEWIN